MADNESNSNIVVMWGVVEMCYNYLNPVSKTSSLSSINLYIVFDSLRVIYMLFCEWVEAMVLVVRASEIVCKNVISLLCCYESQWWGEDFIYTW